VFVSNENDGTISVIDLQDASVTATIPVGKRPRGMRVAGKTLYVALSGSPKGGPGIDEATLPAPDRSADGIGVVDTARLALVHTLESGADPESFSLAGTQTLVVANEDTGEASFVDLGTRRVRGRVQIGGEPEGVATAPDGLVWITSEADNIVAIVDPVAARVVGKVPVGKRPRSVAFTRSLAVVTGENDASVTFIDAYTHVPLGRLELPPDQGQPPRPMGIAISRDERHAFVTTGRAGSIVVIDLDTRAVARVISGVGKRPWGITLGGDGLLYTANGPSDDVTAVDPESGEIVRHIHAGGSPWGVVAI
jgi:YVTN family beta-propeller protein